MELDEFHVRHPAAGAPRHGNAVAGRGVRVGRIEIDLARTAGGQHRVGGRDRAHGARGVVEHIEAVAAVARQAELGGRDQVDRKMIFDDRDVRVLSRLLGQRGDHGVARGVRRVDDAAAAVAAFARQVEAQFGLRVAREGHAPVDEPLDGFAPVLHDEARRSFVAQAGAGNQRVLRVLVVAVAGVEHCGDAALGPVAGALGHGALAENNNPVAIGQFQRDGEAGQPAADDRDVEVHGAGRAERMRVRESGKVYTRIRVRGRRSPYGARVCGP
ncbi:hypothetical protein D3C86_1405390 [compost metagenome]